MIYRQSKYTEEGNSAREVKQINNEGMKNKILLVGLHSINLLSEELIFFPFID